ncbi:PH domain-containing protein [Levilactobacillus angrenensis]|uniref:PH domain-containing protein n=1 Tax=Levilactobacillus angrenensis TaxID=2486020 RepID=A0ABW1UAJ1_9LACO|nr:PH domain-containing protein [Levilactobacillus angrenensis]
MTKPKRTHPLGLLQHIAKSIKDYWFLLILVLTSHDYTSIWFWGIMTILLVAFFIWPLAKWLTLTYVIAPDAIVVHSGVFVRHHEHIPYARIQTVQNKQWFYLRPFKLEEVLIETASHSDSAPEARLTAVPITVAQLINHYRQVATTAPTATDPQTDDSPATATEPAPVTATPQPAAYYQINYRDLVKFGLTSLIFIPFLLVLLGLYNKIPHKVADALIDDASHLGLTLLIGGAIVIVLIAWLGAFLWTLTRYYHFELSRSNHQLVAAKGLFQRNTVTAPLDRLQGVRIKQNILRQWLHLQTIQVLVASKAASDDDDNDLVVMPVIDNAIVYRTMQPFIQWLPSQQPDLSALRVARSWYQIRNTMLVVAVPIALLWWLWPSWGWLSLILLPIAALQGRFAAKNTAGALLSPKLLALQTGHFWERELYYIPTEKIQSMKVTRSIWMKRTHLAHLVVNIRHGNHNQAIELRYLHADAAHAIYDWYLHRT